jgi:hypothetical protein
LGQWSLAFNQGLLRPLAKKLEGASSQGDDLAFAVFSVVVGLDVSIGDGLDHLHDVVGLRDQGDQRLVLGLEQLEQGPDGDVLEGRVAAGEEAS